LFLGEWCRRHSRKSVWKKLNADLEPYHWDDRKKLYMDYKYLEEFHEKLLISLSDKLNELHSVKYSQQYWRILIGPWLKYFTEILFDRWFMLQQVIEQGKIDSCRIYERAPELLIPKDMAGFNKLYVEDDWNEAIYGQLIKILWGERVLVENVSFQKYDNLSYEKYINFFLHGWKKCLKRLISSVIYTVNKLTTRDDDFFLISSYLPLNTEFQLQLKLGQFPKLWFSMPFTLDVKPDIQKRQWKLDLGTYEDAFSKIACQMIPKHIPTAYLEGYGELADKVNRLAWPKKPKAIFTSNAYSADDLFKCWAAGKVENKVPIVIGQHGGNFGMTPFASHEEHQIKIADRWLSWGWQDTKRKKIVPIGNLKTNSHKVKHDPKGDVLMVTMALPRYSYYLYSVPIAGQWLHYFKDQKRFLKALPNELYKRVLLRLYHQDYGWDQMERWRDVMPDVRMDNGNKKFRQVLGSSRIFIGTYNATTYLETLAWNIPTIVYWDNKYWELKDEVKPFFEMLKNAKIFHESPEEAAQHLINIWDDVDYWWKNEKVQKARKDFCKFFSTRNNDLINDIAYILRQQ